MKTVKKTLSWIFSVFMLLSAVGFFPSAASIVMVLTALLALPLAECQRMVRKVIHRNLKAPLIVLLFVVSIILAPTEEADIQTPEDIAPAVMTSPVQTTEAPTTLPAEETEPATVPSAQIPINYEYDALQTLFLAITLDTSIEEIEKMIADSGLCYTYKEFNKSGAEGGGKSISYRLAYTDGATKQSYADFGDFLDVDFDKETGSLMTAEYFSAETFCSALLYGYGIWWEFRSSNAEDYSGYYLIDYRADEDGIILKYNNGNETTTHYFPYETSEALIQHIISLTQE